MVRALTEEEIKLKEIYRPHIDPKTHTLKEDAPIEAKEALKKRCEIADKIRYEAMFG